MAIVDYKVLPKANHCIRLFLFALIILHQTPVFAQQNVKLDINSAYRQYLNFQLDSCAKTLEQLPSSPLSFYLKVLLTSTTISIQDRDILDKSAKNHENEFLSALDKTDFDEANTNFLKSEIKLQWAILKFKNGDEFSSFWSLKQAYSLALENVNRHPDFMPSYKTLGLLHILFGVFPEKYHWILSILGIEGNVDLGLSELEKTYNSNSFFSLECGLIRALAQTYLLNSTEKSVESLTEINKKNDYLLVNYTFALVLMKNAESENTLAIIEHAEHKYPQPFVIPQLYYLKGEILLQKSKYEEAIKNYTLFLNSFSGENLIKDAYFKIGICYFLQDKPEQAKVNFAKSKENGSAKIETDKNAQIALEQEVISSKELYMMRYATDGGYYEKALKIHDNIDSSKFNDHDLCEFYYRSARLFHKSGNQNKAIENYLKTIQFQKVPNWYFAPNAALYLGLMYKEQNKNKEALYYLAMIGNYNGYPYQNSIRQKSALALKGLK